jgi:hypothetical protein
LYLRQHSSSSFWRAWLALLPPLKEITAAGCWTDAELQQLQLHHYKVSGLRALVVQQWGQQFSRGSSSMGVGKPDTSCRLPQMRDWPHVPHSSVLYCTQNNDTKRFDPSVCCNVLLLTCNSTYLCVKVHMRMLDSKARDEAKAAFKQLASRLASLKLAETGA